MRKTRRARKIRPMGFAVSGKSRFPHSRAGSEKKMNPTPRKSIFQIEKKSIPKLILGYAVILSIIMGVVYAALTSTLRSYQNDLTQTAQLQYNRLTRSLDKDLDQFAATAREM